MDLGLKGKVAIVTGGGTGIGAGICEALAQEGVNVAVNWIVGKDEVTAFAAELSMKYGTDCRPFYADVSKAEDLDAMVKDVIAAYGHIDILVNNAGIWPTENILDMPDSNWEKVIAINLNGPFMLCKRVAQHMVSAGIKGSIINLSSKSGITYNTAGHAHYASAKAAINMMTKTLARELLPARHPHQRDRPGHGAHADQRGQVDRPRAEEVLRGADPLRDGSPSRSRSATRWRSWPRRSRSTSWAR